MGKRGSFAADQRAVSAVLGFVLMFTLAMTTLVIYQSDVVPSQNEGIEHEHNEGMAEELGSLRSVAEGVSASGAPGSTTVDTGPEYPERAVGLNAPGGDGQLRTGSAREIRITGFDHTNGDVWESSGETFQTRLIHYEPRYNYYDGAASYTIENGRTVKRFAGDAGGRHVGGAVVSGNRIDILLIGGELDTGGSSADVRFEPVSTAEQYRLVETVDGTDTEIRLPTTMPESDWQDRVGDDPNVSVESYDAVDETVTISFEDGQYRIRVAKVTVDDAVSPSVHTITKGNDPVANVGEATTLEAIARDRFGNPVPGAAVTFEGPSISSTTVETDEDGVAKFPVRSVTQRENIDATVSTGAGTESVTYTLDPGQPMTVDSKNQLYRGLELEEFRLENGETVVREGSNCVLGLGGGILESIDCNEETYAGIELDASIEDNDDGDSYRIRVFLQDFNRDGDFSDNRGPLNPTPDDQRLVVIDKNGAEIAAEELTPSAAEDILTEGGTDLLDASNYQGNPDVDEVDVDDGELIINEINGRVQVETEV